MQPIPDALKQPSDGFEFKYSNPLVGPVYVEGAEPGDALAVHIEKIALNRNTAWSAQNTHFGSLTGEQVGRELLINEPLEARPFHYDVDLERMVATIALEKSRQTRIEVLLHPFIGSIGVAPRWGRVENTLTPGEFGGKMDCVETRAGTTLYLPVWARGAYLEFGDVHAAQGDGEICGTAIEISAEVTLRVEVQKNRRFDWPRLEDVDYLMTTGSLQSLMDAVRLANVEMLKWLVSDYGFDKWEAWQVMSQVSTMRIGNVVDPCYTVVVKFPKRVVQ
jgi:acetamidase/formamidase